MKKAGFSVKSLQYVLRETVNKKEQVSVQRVFLQGKFVKVSNWYMFLVLSDLGNYFMILVGLKFL